MPEAKAYSYAAIRLVPRVEREEFLNVGVILFCPELRFLESRVEFSPERVSALWPAVPLPSVARHLAAIPRLCLGVPEAGPIARLTQKERFHWLVAPRSTVIQVSPVRSGLTSHPYDTLRQLTQALVG